MPHDNTGGSADGTVDRIESTGLVDRRRFVRAAGAAGVVGLSGCMGLGGGGGGGSGGSGGNGSGGGGGGSGDMELTYQTLFVGGDGEVMANIVDRFNEEQPVGDGITINRQRTPWEEHYNQLFTSMTGGNAPDLAISHATYLRRFRDTLTDISDYISSDDYVESIRNSVTLDGSQYAVPMDSHPIGLYYNRDILDEAGVEPPFESFSAFEEACNAVRDNTDAMAFGPSPVTGTGDRQWFTSLAQLGGSMFDEDRTEATFDEGPGLEAARYHASISGDRGWDRPDTSENRVTQSFENGSIAMTLNGTWAVNTMREVDFDWGMSKPHVTPNAEGLRTATDSHTIIVPRQSNASEERIQAAVDAAEWITQENPEWGTKAGHLPAYNPILNGDQLQQSDVWELTLGDFTEMAQNDQLAYFPQLGGVDFYDEANWTWLLDVYGHNVSPEEGVKRGVQQWNSNL